MEKHSLEEFAPLFQKDFYTKEDQWHLAPFFTNLDKSVYAPLIFSPELIGALCSRTSRAQQDLRHIFLKEFIYPFVKPERNEKESEEEWREKLKHGKILGEFISFLQERPILELFSNPRARSFYVKWLAEYGDDSIAQMAGIHLCFWGLSQIAIKHLEDQRIGLAPIEKSTRYVNYSQKTNGRYLYYTDPTLKDLGLYEEYRAAMDGLFDAYTALLPKMKQWLGENFPEEKPAVVEKKTFDVLRGLLPTSTISQVSFFGNGQSFEHLINRSSRHHLGEIRWAAEAAYRELNQVAPSFLRRLKDEEKKEIVENYQKCLAQKGRRIAPFTKKHLADGDGKIIFPASASEVRLVECDPEGENKIIAGILYSSPNNHLPWEEILSRAGKLPMAEKEKIIHEYLGGRNQRWQKVGRAFENVYVRWEIVMNIGAWRDLHRHRMLTQQRQNFSCEHGYEIPEEVGAAGLAGEFRKAIEPVEKVYQKIAACDPDLAQYAVTLAHRIRFMQWENLRQSFWQIELRTIPEGHPDYRKIEQEKFRLLEKIYPLIAKHIRVNLGQYDFARRGQEEKIRQKTEKLSQTS